MEGETIWSGRICTSEVCVAEQMDMDHKGKIFSEEKEASKERDLKDAQDSVLERNQAK